MFQDESLKQDIEVLDFDHVSKILSDIVHFGGSSPVAARLEILVDKKENIIDLNHVFRVLDQLAASDFGL